MVPAVDIRSVEVPEQYREAKRTLSDCICPFSAAPWGSPVDEHGFEVLAWYELTNDLYERGVLLSQSATANLQRHYLFARDVGAPRCAAIVDLAFNEEWTPTKAKIEIDKSTLAENQRDTEAWVSDASLIVLFANALANCRNVAFEEDHSGRRREQTERLRIEGRGIVWNRLVIGNPNQRSEHAANKLSASRPVTRLHLCRGHFKTFTESAPLLGKHVGRWWWMPLVRGDKAVGAVVKDYVIAPRPEAVS